MPRDLSWEEAAKQIKAWVDIVGDGTLDQSLEVSSFVVELPSGNRAVLVVVREDVWDELQRILAESGCKKVQHLIN